MMVERQLATEGMKRQDLGREKFIERVWDWRKHYGGAILDQMKRLGASVDWHREYFTMDENLSHCRARGVRPPVRRRTDLSRQVHRELVSALRNGDLRPRSGARRVSGQAVRDSLSGGRQPTSSSRWPPRVRKRCSAILPLP